MSAMASQITSLTIVYSTVYSGADQRKHQSSASLAFMRGIHRWPVNSPHKGPVTRKMLLFDDVIMIYMFPDTDSALQGLTQTSAGNLSQPWRWWWCPHTSCDNMPSGSWPDGKTDECKVYSKPMATVDVFHGGHSRCVPCRQQYMSFTNADPPCGFSRTSDGL